MKLANHNLSQEAGSVASFGWQWTQAHVYETMRECYRKLFLSRGVWYDYYDDKVVADVGSGSGRFTYALARLTKARRIISVELSQEAIEKQKTYITDPRVEFIRGDVAQVKYKADIIYAAGFIQHTASPKDTLRNLIDNLNDRGEILISFYMRTPTTLALEPLRFILKRLPVRVLWFVSYFLGPLFFLRRANRTLGLRNAQHTAYDWFGSHKYQYYFTDAQVREYLRACGIRDENVLEVSKGLYRARKGEFPLVLDDKLMQF